MTMKLLAAAVLGTALVSPAAFAADAHWAYEGHSGAAHWAELDKAFETCRSGRSQSPVNITTGDAEASTLQRIKFNYAATVAEVVNNGHTIQIDLPKAGSARIDDVEYKLVQMHFHTPSEMTIDGHAYPLVAHLVHRDAGGRLAVVAVLFAEGRENATLKPVFANLPAREGEARALESPFDVTGLLPDDQAYYALMGSLTTPPCSEDVRWRILKTPVELAPAQVAAFRKLYTINARPVQPLNGRKVHASQ